MPFCIIDLEKIGDRWVGKVTTPARGKEISGTDSESAIEVIRAFVREHVEPPVPEAAVPRRRAQIVERLGYVAPLTVHARNRRRGSHR